MNRNRNIVIDFRINGKHDHTIAPKSGRPITKRPTKKRRR